MNIEVRGQVNKPIAYSADRRHRNLDLQWLRVIAAFIIVLYHASALTAYHDGDDRFAAIFGNQFGIAGVAIFFAISGALMADLVQSSDAHQFLMHRILRIYPIFILVSLLLPNLIGDNPGVDVRALTLFPTGGKANYRLSLIEWTLVFEMFFYVLLYFISIVGLRRHIEAIAIVWLSWIGGVTILGWATPRMTAVVPYLTDMPFQTTSAAFAAGLLVPSLARRGVFSPAMAPLAAGLMLLCGMSGLAYDRLIASLAAMIFVGLVVQMNTARSTSTVFSQAATKLGDWSYALYLCHALVMTWVLKRVDLPSFELWGLVITASLLACVPLGILDVRIYRALRRRLSELDDRKVRHWAAIYAMAYVVTASIFAMKR